MGVRMSCTGAATAVLCCCVAAGAEIEDDAQSIRPWPENPYYWQYRGEPVMLLGGTDDDSLFQMPNMAQQVTDLVAVGGNVVRNTMSDRQDHDFEVYPYAQTETGKYDLMRWNEEYWRRFDAMLRLTEEHGIIVQIEVWDRFDFTDMGGMNNWKRHPYNPANNVNYTHAESGLAETYPDHPGTNRHPFFFTTPEQRNNTIVLPYQQRFVDKMLSYTLRHPHVLYCMDNETQAEEAWGAYWASAIRAKAREVGRRVCLTEMWDDWNIRSPSHQQTFAHPDLYDFVDISQNNHNKGDTHWGNVLWVRDDLKQQPRPINTTKTYGADGGRFGSSQDGMERFWRHILAGVASARFHRPSSGLGLSPVAKAGIQAARRLETYVRFWDLEPDNNVLTDRQPDSAYAAISPHACVVFLPKGGSVGVSAKAVGNASTIHWISIASGAEGPETRIDATGDLTLTAPTSAPWVAVIPDR